MSLIIAFLIAGVLFICTEVFLPSGIIATLGGLCLFAAAALGVSRYNVFVGLLVGVGGLAVSALAVYVELKLLPHTRAGKKFYNESASGGRAVDTGTATALELVGKPGRAATAFAPTGLAEIDGRQYEASCLDGFLHPGDALIVAGRDNYKLLVKKAAG
ncbi:MAG TPA: NfeD family protein [Opitutales bacterium]|nr:NfeD family protein [Opitutales bacterium]